MIHESLWQNVLFFILLLKEYADFIDSISFANLFIFTLKQKLKILNNWVFLMLKEICILKLCKILIFKQSWHGFLFVNKLSW